MDCSPPGSAVHGISQAKILSELPFLSPEDLPDPGINSASPAFAGGFFTTDPPGKPKDKITQQLFLRRLSHLQIDFISGEWHLVKLEVCQ